MDISSQILLAYITYLIGTISPGPSNLAIIKISAQQGRISGVYFALGVVVGSTVWGVLAAFGLTKIIQSYNEAFTLLKIIGGIYLLWMAYNTAKSAFDSKTFQGTTPISKRYFLHGLALHLTNPKAMLVWTAIITIGVTPQATVWTAPSIMVGCSILGAMVFISYALIFSNPSTVALYHRGKKPFELITATIFGLAGIKLLNDEI